VSPSLHLRLSLALRVLVFGASIFGAFAFMPERRWLSVAVLFLPLLLFDLAWSRIPLHCDRPGCEGRPKMTSRRPARYRCENCGAEE
jgi:hypothetical protein